MNIPLDIKGWIKITDAESRQILVEKSNAIHYENFSEALARSISSGPLNANDVESANGFIKTMVFGNGGTDGDVATKGDNVPFQIGLNDSGFELIDGGNMDKDLAA